ncbi:MAG: hypothetical protein ABSE93_00525 [Terriglobia bacterium]
MAIIAKAESSSVAEIKCARQRADLCAMPFTPFQPPAIVLLNFGIPIWNPR